jgi:hypothetical protein
MEISATYDVPLSHNPAKLTLPAGTITVERALDGLDFLRQKCLIPFVGTDCSYVCAQQHQQSFLLALVGLLIVWMTGVVCDKVIQPECMTKAPIQDYWTTVINAVRHFFGTQISAMETTFHNIAAKVYVQCAFSASAWWGAISVYLDRLDRFSRDLVSAYF